MKKKRTICSEAAYAMGLTLLAMATALTERADLGMSMVVAPSYLLYRKISLFFPAFTFGMAEYSLQALLLIVLAVVVRRVRLNYLLSFVTAVLSGNLLDLFVWLLSMTPEPSFAGRIALYAAGILICALGVAMMFHTYLAPGAYELFVKEISRNFGTRLSVTKTVYDCASCLAAIVLSFMFFGFGRFEGIKAGTVICALVNGPLIGLFSRLLESRFTFRDAWKFREFFEGKQKER